ncbi:MAG: hypothetical protein GY719_37445 [bacterium]|nr:hypothetical protein [bacterium]
MQAPKNKTIAKTIVAALFLAMLTLAAGAASAQEDKKPAAQQGQTEAAARDGMTRVISRMWWNQPEKVATLALKVEQREKMDTLGRAYLESQRGSNAGREAFGSFAEALEAGDWDAARERSKTLAEATSGPVQAQANLMIDALALLSADQRAKLAAELPGLLSGPWMRMRGMGRNRPGNRPE